MHMHKGLACYKPLPCSITSYLQLRYLNSQSHAPKSGLKQAHANGSLYRPCAQPPTSCKGILSISRMHLGLAWCKHMPMAACIALAHSHPPFARVSGGPVARTKAWPGASTCHHPHLHSHPPFARVSGGPVTRAKAWI